MDQTRAIARSDPRRPAAAAGALVVRLFGRLSVAAEGEELGPTTFGGRKPKQLLEILLVERGHVVSKSRLEELLWPDNLLPTPGQPSIPT